MRNALYFIAGLLIGALALHFLASRTVTGRERPVAVNSLIYHQNFAESNPSNNGYWGRATQDS